MTALCLLVVHRNRCKSEEIPKAQCSAQGKRPMVRLTSVTNESQASYSAVGLPTIFHCWTSYTFASRAITWAEPEEHMPLHRGNIWLPPGSAPVTFGFSPRAEHCWFCAPHSIFCGCWEPPQKMERGAWSQPCPSSRENLDVMFSLLDLSTLPSGENLEVTSHHHMALWHHCPVHWGRGGAHITKLLASCMTIM